MKKNNMKKFIAKNNNYRVVLKHGIPAEPITGRNAEPGVYVKFEQGVAVVNDDAIADMMMKHPGFGVDYVLAPEVGTDPYVATRKPSEPEHDMIEIDKGTVGKNLNPKIGIKFTADQQKVINQMVQEKAMEILPSMVETVIKSMAEKAKANKAEKEKTTDEQVD